MYKFGYLMPYLFAAPTLLGFLYGGLYWWIIPAMYLSLPIADLIVGGKDRFVARSKVGPIEYYYYRILMVLFVPVQSAIILYGCYYFSKGNFQLYEAIGIIFSIGILTGGVGLNIAHECTHKTNPMVRNVGRFFLIVTGWCYFAVEHPRVHHKFSVTGTKKDPVLSVINETLYSFIPKSIWRSHIATWQYELSKHEGSAWKTLKESELSGMYLLSLIFHAAVFAIFGAYGLAFTLINDLVAILMLQHQDYVHHYGLTRRTLNDGSYEKYQDFYTWSSNSILANWALFELPRHAFHHKIPYANFEEAVDMNNESKMPYGYFTMLFISFFPFAWFKLMNPKVEEVFRKREISNTIEKTVTREAV